MKRARLFISICTLALIVTSVVAPAAASTSMTSAVTDATLAGEWSAPFSENGRFDSRAPQTREESKELPTAVNIAVSPDGTVIYWNGMEGFEDLTFSAGGPDQPTQKSRSRILDLRAFLRGDAPRPTWWTPAQERGIGPDMFCGDLRTLSDGRLLVVGGTEFTNADESLGLGMGRTKVWGVRDARVYDPETARWTQAEPMHHKRWYPSLLTLADGKMLVAGGVEEAAYNEKLSFVNQTETFDPATGRWTENGPEGETPLPYYARLHLLSSGKVFYGASGQMWGPAPWLPPRDMTEWSMQRLYDPVTKSWKDVGLAPLGGRSGTFSAMLPLKPPYDATQILIGGGTLSPVVHGSYVGMNITELVTATGDNIERELGPSMNNPRWHSAGVVLPSGEVIALNGGDRDETAFGGLTNAVPQAEMFDGEKWVRLASSTRDRVYHHTAILLGDGSILVGGHAPIGFTPFLLRPDNYTNGTFASLLKDPSFEIFKPPYLFRGTRPRLSQVQSGIALGETFKITSPDAGKITSVVLSKLPSVTHLVDLDNRTIELDFTRTSEGTLEAAMPKNPAVALPGHYYLFLMTDNGQGPTPSRAAIVQVGETDHSAAPQPFGR